MKKILKPFVIIGVLLLLIIGFFVYKITPEKEINTDVSASEFIINTCSNGEEHCFGYELFLSTEEQREDTYQCSIDFSSSAINKTKQASLPGFAHIHSMVYLKKTNEYVHSAVTPKDDFYIIKTDFDKQIKSKFKIEKLPDAIYENGEAAFLLYYDYSTYTASLYSVEWDNQTTKLLLKDICQDSHLSDGTAVILSDWEKQYVYFTDDSIIYKSSVKNEWIILRNGQDAGHFETDARCVGTDGTSLYFCQKVLYVPFLGYISAFTKYNIQKNKQYFLSVCLTGASIQATNAVTPDGKYLVAELYDYDNCQGSAIINMETGRKKTLGHFPEHFWKCSMLCVNRDD